MASKTQTKASSRSKVRSNEIRDLWTAPAPPLDFGREQFRFSVDRSARRLATISIDSWIEDADWTRAGPNRTGDVNFYRPLGAHAASMITYGDMLICEWSQFDNAGPWNRLWRMKIATPEQELQEGIITLTLSSVLDGLTKSKVAWKFRTDKTHPNGWTADQITIAVCKRFHIPLISVPKGTWHIDKYVRKSESPEDVITWAWAQERKHTGRRFDVDSSTGEVNVTELAEPKYMLILGADMIDATVKQSMTGIASAVVATSTHKVKGHKKDTKLRVKVVDPGREKRYGYIVKTMKAPSKIQSTADLRDWAKRRLATMYRAKKQLQFVHPGIPLVDRGTALRIYLPEADLEQIVFVTSAEHSLSAGSYQIQCSCGFDDPFAADLRKARVQQKKDAAAAARKRKAAQKKADAPKPKKAATRSNAK